MKDSSGGLGAGSGSSSGRGQWARSRGGMRELEKWCKCTLHFMAFGNKNIGNNCITSGVYRCFFYFYLEKDFFLAFSGAIWQSGGGAERQHQRKPGLDTGKAFGFAKHGYYLLVDLVKARKRKESLILSIIKVAYYQSRLTLCNVFPIVFCAKMHGLGRWIIMRSELRLLYCASIVEKKKKKKPYTQ